MPVTIRNGQVKIKGTNGYVSVDTLADSTTASRIAAINAAGTEAVGDIQDEGAAQVAAIEAAGAEVMADIPADYSALSDEVSDLKSALKYNSENILDFVAKTSPTINGVTFTYNSDGSYHVYGTATALVNKVLINSASALPEGVVPGGTYFIRYSSERVVLRIIPYVQGVEQSSIDSRLDETITLPEGLTGVIIRLVVNNGVTVDEVVKPQILTAPSNVELANRLEISEGQIETQTVRLNKTVDQIKPYNTYDILAGNVTKSNKTISGVTFEWGEDGCTVSGTSTALINNDLISSLDNVPDWIVPGKTYFVNYSGTNVIFRIIPYINGTAGNSIDIKDSKDVLIPDNLTGIIIRLVVNSGKTVNEIVNPSMLVLGMGYYKSQNLLNTFQYRAQTISNGVTYTPQSGGQSVQVSGLATQASFRNLFFYGDGVPEYLEKGKTYYCDFESTDSNIYIEFLTYSDGYFQNNSWAYRINKKGYFTVPEWATRFGMRLYVFSGTTVNGTVSTVKIYKSQPDEDRPKTIPSYKMPLLVSFVDDDATNDTYVDRYYQNCKHNGIVGNYAVITLNLDNGDTSAEHLIAYENDGFGMTLHCHDQRGEETNYWLPSNRNLALCRENLITGLRKMGSYGFVNYKHWITPYGVKDEEMISLCRYLGLDSLFTYDDTVANYPAITSRYGIKRINFSPNDNVNRTSMAGVKSIIDDFAKSITNGGWLIITTHFNSWGSLTFDDTTDENGYKIGYSRFNELAQYVISKGLTVVSVQEGLSYISPFFTD